MQTSVNTEIFRSIKWSEDPQELKKELTQFSFRLAEWCAAINQAFAAPNAIAQLLNGSGLLTPAAGKQVGSTLSTLAGGTYNVACDGASSVTINGVFTVAGTSTVTLTHLPNGVIVMIILQNSSAGTGSLSFTGSTQPNGTAYTSFLFTETGTGGFVVNPPCVNGKGVVVTMIGFGALLFGTIMTTA